MDANSSKLYGLVLAGGRSKRMGQDKALMVLQGRPQLDVCVELLGTVCERVFVSTRPDQADEPGRKKHPQIVDAFGEIGPMGGILSAMAEHPGWAWLVVACDLPRLDASTLRHLIAHRNVSRLATAYRGHENLPEPLCAIYEPAYFERLKEFLDQGIQCPRKAMIRSDVELLELPDPRVLENVNTPGDF
ncbi:MAG TPA: NTP transferase domain-containing protein [Kiritimatiellia bacterium]|jgi:molybdopterin-guanine dinucleotide biosynthesis protein A